MFFQDKLQTGIWHLQVHHDLASPYFSSLIPPHGTSHSRDSEASWTPAHASPSNPWGPGSGTQMQPSSLNETGRVPRGCRRVGVWESALGGPLLLQDTLLTAESKACARDPNGFAFWGCCVLAPVGAPWGRLLMIWVWGGRYHGAKTAGRSWVCWGRHSDRTCLWCSAPGWSPPVRLIPEMITPLGLCLPSAIFSFFKPAPTPA